MTTATEKTTAAELAARPADGLVRELHDGEVVVLPAEDEHHAWHVRLADMMLSVGAPVDVEIHERTGVHVADGHFYVPDVLVVRKGTPFRDNGFEATGVLLVVEVIGPETLVADRLTKPWLYAEAGIPYFWRIDQGPRLVALRLDPSLGDGHYIYDTELVPSEDGEVEHPWSARIDMAEFVTPPSLRLEAP